MSARVMMLMMMVMAMIVMTHVHVSACLLPYSTVAAPRRGLGAICMYCGDGNNDFIALAAADWGLAIGNAPAYVECLSDEFLAS